MIWTCDRVPQQNSHSIIWLHKCKRPKLDPESLNQINDIHCMMHVFARGAEFPWGSLWKHLRSVPRSCAVPDDPRGSGHFPGRQLLCCLESGAGRLLCQARISLLSLPPAYWIKTCTLFVLAQCINSVLQKTGREPAFKARGMQLMRKWKQNCESWKHQEQDKIRNQAGGCWVYRDVCSWERLQTMSQHWHRLHPKSSCDTASASQHLPLHTQSEGSSCALPCSSIYRPKATPTRAKERLGPQGNTCSCSEKGASVIPGWQQQPRGLCPSSPLLSWQDKKFSSRHCSSGNPGSGIACQARLWKTWALEQVCNQPQTSSPGQAHSAVFLLSWQEKRYLQLLLWNYHVGFWHCSNPTWKTTIMLTTFLSGCSGAEGFKLVLQVLLEKQNLTKKYHNEVISVA